VSDICDASYSLGFCKMPEGYRLIQIDSGHYMWRHEESDAESCIHWNKWAVYHGAKEDSKERNEAKP